MTVAREAIVLPSLFLTVLLLGGLRIADTTMLVPPSPYVLLIGVLLVRVVVRSGALAPGQVLAAARPTLANLNGAALIATLWLGGAQTLALLIPESGVPRLVFSVFFLVLLLSTAAASPDRERLVRSLAVTFGAAYVLKFVVLHGLSAPDASAFKRVLLELVDAATAGALIQDVPHPITAYIALLTVALYLVGVFLLPHHERRSREALPETFLRTLPPA